MKTVLPLGLYLHIPFCKAKCIYCDFYSLPHAEDRMDAYTDALCAHLTEAAPNAAVQNFENGAKALSYFPRCGNHP